MDESKTETLSRAENEWVFNHLPLTPAQRTALYEQLLASATTTLAVVAPVIEES